MYLCRKKNMNTDLYIKDILKEKGITSKELATMLDKAPQYISNIINGGKGASISTLEDIAAALKVPMWQLFASPEEVRRISVPSDLVAFICYKGTHYTADSVQQLRAIVEKLERYEETKI